MLQVKLQFEVRYTNILNFQAENRKILSPFLRISDLTINNLDTSEEYLILMFKEEGYYIDARWDRLILVYDGALNTIEDYQNIFKHYLDILNKYSKLDTFGKITHAIMVRHLIKEIEDTDENIRREFKRSYFTSNVPYLDGEDQDLGITLENKKGKETSKITFGLFKSIKDIARFNLFAINPSKRNTIIDKKGLFYEYVLGIDLSQVDFNTIKKFYMYQKRFLETFK